MNRLIAGLLVAFAVGCFSPVSRGQGTVQFITQVPRIVDAPVRLWNGDPPGPAYAAELVRVLPDGAVLPIPGSLTRFQDPGPGGNLVLAGYIVPVTVSIPGVPAGGSVTLRFRAYLASVGSFEAASWY